jgi:hypothetical protein
MRCNRNRWRISKALDTDGSLPPSLERHLQDCEACREFFRLSSSLPQKGKADLADLLSGDKADLSRRIIASLDQAPAPGRAERKRPPFLVPALSAALSVTLLALGLVLLRPSSPADISELNPLSEWKNAEAGLSSLAARVDSPYRTELANLRTSFVATAEFFRSFMDIGLGEEE